MPYKENNSLLVMVFFISRSALDIIYNNSSSKDNDLSNFFLQNYNTTIKITILYINF